MAIRYPLPPMSIPHPFTLVGGQVHATPHLLTLGAPGYAGGTAPYNPMAPPPRNPVGALLGTISQGIAPVAGHSWPVGQGIVPLGGHTGPNPLAVRRPELQSFRPRGNHAQDPFAAFLDKLRGRV